MVNESSVGLWLLNLLGFLSPRTFSVGHREGRKRVFDITGQVIYHSQKIMLSMCVSHKPTPFHKTSSPPAPFRPPFFGRPMPT
ncbi:hypothetical protein B0H63DRAFT_472346 [Podospora didyma]|uniref:Secreted protein n=1 Tax=Podospora didyma TaxID=330526 RepID=A0AAE0NP30_9PEZI|nr:hypothetical protein B0H63DRAFT_472346 [Podospora didyma]